MYKEFGDREDVNRLFDNAINKMEPQKDQPCMFDEVTKDPNYKNTPLWLYCPCPKCSPWR